MRLKNKIALITGASAGIGRCMAETFVQEGAVVINYDWQAPETPIDGAEFHQGSVADPDAVERCFSSVLAQHGRIDVLINNAGITRDALVQKMTDAMWLEVIEVNLRGVFNWGRQIGPQMMQQEHGSIINIASVVAEFGNIGQSNYAAAKAGIIGLTKTWAKEFSRKGQAVRVNAIAPGFINTEMMRTIPDKVLDPIRAATLLGRLGEPAEIAKAALFLASDESSFITAHTLSVNGGLRL